MTREDIIAMAREASPFGKDSRLYFLAELTPEVIERFAALVASQERDACAKVADLVAREIDDTNGTATYIANRIRARGETK